MNDRDMWATAALMIKRYGDNATVQAGMRADELAGEGDHTGASTWKRISRAITQLTEPSPSGMLH